MANIFLVKIIKHKNRERIVDALIFLTFFIATSISCLMLIFSKSVILFFLGENWIAHEKIFSSLVLTIPADGLILTISTVMTAASENKKLNYARIFDLFLIAIVAVACGVFDIYDISKLIVVIWVACRLSMWLFFLKKSTKFNYKNTKFYHALIFLYVILALFYINMDMDGMHLFFARLLVIGFISACIVFCGKKLKSAFEELRIL